MTPRRAGRDRRGDSCAAAIAAVLFLTGHAAPAAAQAALELRAAAGAALSTPLLRDGNGTEVRLGAQPYAAVRITGPAVARSVRLVASGRLAASHVRLRAPAARWRAGTTWQPDIAAGVEAGAGSWLDVRALAGATWLLGPRSVAPFSGLRGPVAAAEAGAALRLPKGALRLDVAVQGYRISPPDGDRGGVARLLVGLAHAW